MPFIQLARADKPIGTWLLYLPCSWSVLNSARSSITGISGISGELNNVNSLLLETSSTLPPENTLKYLALCGIGAFVMRGAGCTINDLWDRRIDKLVQRTSTRPLASGQISPFNAFVFLGAQLSVGLLVLLQFNLPSILVGCLSLPLVCSYPFFKRITFWPQAILGLTFNWGALVGSTAMLGYVSPSALCLYSAGFFWTLVYDTIYALQDIKDDRKVGVKSTAILFGSAVKPILSAFAGASVSLIALAGYLSGCGPLFYTFSVLGSGLHYAWQIKSLNPLDVKDCWKKFASNKTLGLIVAGGLALDALTTYI